MCSLIRSTRRQFLRSSLTSGLALGSAGFAVLGRSTPSLAQTSPTSSVFQRFVRPPYLGTTFSQLQCRYIGLDYRAAFQDICQIGLDRIRLCAYWNEIETQPGLYDFSILDWLLAEADRNQIEVVLAVGMKVPRWTEFYFPQWVSDRYPPNPPQTLRSIGEESHSRPSGWGVPSIREFLAGEGLRSPVQDPWCNA